jgi:hypothetical protein
MIERQRARRAAEDAAQAGVAIRLEPDHLRAGVATPAPMLVAPGRAGLLNRRHVVPAPETPLSLRTARGR